MGQSWSKPTAVAEKEEDIWEVCVREAESVANAAEFLAQWIEPREAALIQKQLISVLCSLDSLLGLHGTAESEVATPKEHVTKLEWVPDVAEIQVWLAKLREALPIPNEPGSMRRSTGISKLHHLGKSKKGMGKQRLIEPKSGPSVSDIFDRIETLCQASSSYFRSELIKHVPELRWLPITAKELLHLGWKRPSQRQSRFFQLPAEVRELIYQAFVRRESNTMPIARRYQVEFKLEKERGDYQDYPGEAEKDTQYEWLFDRPKREPIVVPCLNGLAQSCSLAYQEGSQLLYQQNHICLNGHPGMVISFLRDHQPSHVHLIQELSLEHLSRLYYKPRKSDRHEIYPPMLKTLKDFASLKVLHLQEWRLDHMESPLPPSKQLMVDLVRNSRTLGSLQTIVVKCSQGHRKMPEYLSQKLDFDDIPGWVYSYTFVEHEGTPWNVDLTETVQRIHGPEGSKIIKKPVPAGESVEDIFEAALSLFGTEPSEEIFEDGLSLFDVEHVEQR